MKMKPVRISVEPTDPAWRPRTGGVSSAGRNTERAVRILDEVLMRAAVESLRGVHAARAALCFMFVVRELVINHHALATGHPRHVITFVLLSVGVVGSIAFFVLVKRVPVSENNLWWGRMFGCRPGCGSNRTFIWRVTPRSASARASIRLPRSAHRPSP